MSWCAGQGWGDAEVIWVEACPPCGIKPRSRELGCMSDGVRMVSRAGGPGKEGGDGMR